MAALDPPPTLPPPPGVDVAVALCAYAGAGRDLVAGVKYRNGRRAAGPVGRAMAGVASAAGAADVAVVTWAPTTVERRRRRGYDQSRLLAGSMARALGLPLVGLLVREGRVAQTGRGRSERLDGVAFRTVRSSPDSVLLVDDVRTTGATLAAAAAALRAVGARRVCAVTAAATP